MDYRCPVCGKEIKNRKLIQFIVARMEIDCPNCRSKLQHNVHWSESAVVFANFALILVLAALAHWSQIQQLIVLVLAAAVLGGAALPVLERTYLRNWRRYVPAAQDLNPPGP